MKTLLYLPHIPPHCHCLLESDMFSGTVQMVHHVTEAPHNSPSQKSHHLPGQQSCLHLAATGHHGSPSLLSKYVQKLKKYHKQFKGAHISRV